MAGVAGFGATAATGVRVSTGVVDVVVGVELQAASRAAMARLASTGVEVRFIFMFSIGGKKLSRKPRAATGSRGG